MYRIEFLTFDMTPFSEMTIPSDSKARLGVVLDLAATRANHLFVTGQPYPVTAKITKQTPTEYSECFCEVIWLVNDDSKYVHGNFYSVKTLPFGQPTLL